MTKYIIKNCPATYENYEDKFVCTSQIKQKGFPFYCQDCTDCVLKRIVELCKGELGSIRTIGKDIMAEEILKLLDIQECE